MHGQGCGQLGGGRNRLSKMCMTAAAILLSVGARGGFRHRMHMCDRQGVNY